MHALNSLCVPYETETVVSRFCNAFYPLFSVSNTHANAQTPSYSLIVLRCIVYQLLLLVPTINLTYWASMALISCADQALKFIL